MSITDQEDSLFAKWRQGREHLVTDGVVNEDEYVRSVPRLLFVLKEVNDTKDGGGWDLREYVRNHAQGQTWNNIARWIYGLRNLNQDIPWASISSIDSGRKDLLQSICVMNLKKSPGGGVANPKVVQEIAQQDKAFLKSQFALYEADIVVCCGTGWLFDELMTIDNAVLQSTSRGIQYRLMGRGRSVIYYCHPFARVDACLLYYGLVDAAKEIMDCEQGQP